MKKPFAAKGTVLVPRHPAEFARCFEDALATWGPVVTEAHLKPE